MLRSLNFNSNVKTKAACVQFQRPLNHFGLYSYQSIQIIF